MQLRKSTDIDASLQAVWNVVTDIKNLASTIQGISSIEILEPATGPSIVGLKWRETRTWRGRDAIEVMWITEAQEPFHYVVQRTTGHRRGQISLGADGLDGKKSFRQDNRARSR